MIVSCIILSLVASASSIFMCPDEQQPPCTCTSIGLFSPTITCENLADFTNVRKSLDLLRHEELNSVIIQESIVQYIPHNLFEGYKFEKFFLINSTLNSLSDTSVAFRGLEDTLKVVVLSNSIVMNGVEWSMLRDLQNLEELIIYNVYIGHIDDDIKDISHLRLKNLRIVKAEVSFLSRNALSSLTNLVSLSLGSNSIEVVQRSMFPGNLNALETLDLSSNKISALPEDFFTNMPKLVSVSLADNAFTTIHEQVFLPIWSQLNKIDVLGNPMRCDCRLKWIVGKGMPKNFWGNCEEPQEVKGKEIKDLGTNDLWC